MDGLECRGDAWWKSCQLVDPCASGPTPANGQCGGVGFDGCQQCHSGLECLVVNAHMLCVAPDPCAISGPTQSGQQCGGFGFTGCSDCQAELFCQGDAQMQTCLPLAAVPSSEVPVDPCSHGLTQQHAECGGSDFDGCERCADGLECQGDIWWKSCQFVVVVDPCAQGLTQANGQCGGAGFDGCQQCHSGLDCLVVNAHMLCVAPDPCTSSGPTQSGQQCGGFGFAGCQECQPGLACEGSAAMQTCQFVDPCQNVPAIEMNGQCGGTGFSPLCVSCADGLTCQGAANWMTCLPEQSLQYWFPGVTCPHSSLPRTGFHGKGFPTNARAQAETECKGKCDGDDECAYAGVHFYENPMDPDFTHCASCYMYSVHCDQWRNFVRTDYSLYVKAGDAHDRLLEDSDRIYLSNARTLHFAHVSLLAIFGFAIFSCGQQ